MAPAGCGTPDPTTADWVSLTSNRLGRALSFAALLIAAAPAPADEQLWNRLQAGGHVLLIRHASTDPGIGDPPGFRLEDCATQRNLSTTGREEARQLGIVLKQRGIPLGAVLSSRWCRCLETARLAFGSGVKPWPALDNTFETPERRAAQMAEIRKALMKPPTDDNLVLVTHGVNIQALTGISPAQGEIVIVRSNGRQPLAVVGRLQPVP